MIVVKIEMWPKGDEKKAYPLGRMFIWNKGRSKGSTDAKANYGFAIRRKNQLEVNDILPLEHQTGNTHLGEIKDHRRNDLVIWVLVMKCLKQIYDKKG